MKIRVLEKCTFATVSVTVSQNLKVFFSDDNVNK